MGIKSIAYSITIFTLTACATQDHQMVNSELKSPPSRAMASVNPQSFLHDFVIDREAGEQYRPNDDAASERKAYQKLIHLFSTHFQKKYGDETARSQTKDQGESGLALRAVHAKGHGCLIGNFTILDHQQSDFKFGVFKAPKKYDVVLRFSNGDGPPEPDSDKKTSIGMAFKLLNVFDEKLLGDLQKDHSADFLMTNHANFIVRDVGGFVEVIEGREGGLIQKIDIIGAAGRGLLQRSKVEKSDPLVTPYWSNLPFKIGKTVAKYLVRPEICSGENDSGEVPVTKSMRKNPDFLSQVLNEHILKHSACFGFFLQRQKSANESPVEDAFVKWPETDDLLVRVATLEIPIQEPNESLPRLPELNSKGLKGTEICQNISFSPWNTTEDIKPLGSLNRSRRVVYELSAAMRRDLNQASDPLEK